MYQGPEKHMAIAKRTNLKKSFTQQRILTLWTCPILIKITRRAEADKPFHTKQNFVNHCTHKKSVNSQMTEKK